MKKNLKCNFINQIIMLIVSIGVEENQNAGVNSDEERKAAYEASNGLNLQDDLEMGDQDEN